ncbi:MAG TPA: serine/threonine-protein kinase, partial [Chthoniobacterales bacterium]|nr:serine/threonine-protein kinase [Chthoniobacterales bacterium]
MTPERWQQIKSVLCNALELPVETEREAYLATACGDDTSLRREVDLLLGPFTDNIEAFAENLRRTLGRTVWSEPIGQRVGAYRIVSEIGRGGMGNVYLAERADGQFEKKVAIKLLKRGTDTDEILRKFQAERQILARLEHPNIARLIDAGTTADGLPYFIMEYVSGAPVTNYVSERDLSSRDRLELFLKICAAVEFAHENGVIHRDLKPSNILVTANGEPKLLDFGIAKLTGLEPDDENLTSAEQRRLTVSYASPEQAAGSPVTFRTDVYALGAVLYEMLTGRRPHRFATPNPSLEEVSRILSQEKIEPPSRVVSDPEIPSELNQNLDGAVLTALRANPEARYPTVKNFAADIRRCLAGEKVQAQPKRRIPAVVAAVLLISLASLGGYLLVTSGLVNPEPTALNAAPEKSLAVLPFQNLSAAPENAFFAAGVQEEILSELAKVADLKVINRASVVQFDPAQPRDLRHIGQSLGVAH